jgi:hypothetical protein
MGDLISARAFAKLEGCSHTLVNRAIERGSLKASKIEGQTRIDADLVGSGWKRSNRIAAAMAAKAGNDDEAGEDDNWKQIAEALPGKTFEEKAAAAASQGSLFNATMAEAERKKTIFATLMAEHKYNEAIGTVVPVDAVSGIVGEKFAAVRTRLMQIPSEEAPRVHRCKTVAEVQA